MSPTLTLKTFDPIAVISLVIVFFVALTPSIMLIFITIPYISQLLKVTVCSSLWPCTTTHSCGNCSIRLIMPSFTSNWAYLIWTLSTLALTQPYGLVHYPHIIIKVVHGITQLLAKLMKEAIPEVFWTFLMLNIIGYSCQTTFSAPYNWNIYILSLFCLPL